MGLAPINIKENGPDARDDQRNPQLSTEFTGNSAELPIRPAHGYTGQEQKQDAKHKQRGQ
jgi:hypothetical protein